MKKKGAKIVLALFLLMGGIITPLLFKKSVKATSYQLNNTYYIAPYKTTGTNNLQTGSEILQDSYGNRLVFRNDLLEGYLGIKFLSFRFGYSNNTLSLLAYNPNTANMYDTPIFSINYLYQVIGNQPSFKFNTFSSPSTNIENYTTQIMTIFSKYGIEAIESYPLPNNQRSTKYIETTSNTYYVINSVFETRESRQSIVNEGIQEVLNNPNNYNLWTNQQILDVEDNAYSNGYDDGYNDGYNNGYTQGVIDIGIEKDNDTYTLTNIFTSVFNTAKNFLGTELIGGIKIIHFIAIPLLLGLFLIILKVFRS